MKGKVLSLILGLIFSLIFVTGCNKKEVQPEIIPTNQTTEVVEIDLGLEVGKKNDLYYWRYAWKYKPNAPNHGKNKL